MPVIEPSLQVHQNQYTSKKQSPVRSGKKKSHINIILNHLLHI